MDEKTPHIHCVVVPLVRKYDKRLTDKGFDLERGIKGSDNKNIKIKEYKKITRKINHDLNVRNERLDKTMSDFEDKMKTNKKIPFYLYQKYFKKLKL